MEESPMKNAYLDQVVESQQKVASDLKAKRVMSYSPAPAAQAADTGAMRMRRAGGGAAAPAPGGNAVDVRVTGFWRWKNVLVPPNAYVVHTRRGRTEPLHVGLGVSFRYDPRIDTFLVVPGTMQTILINAYCICKELQGLVVQGYVQWIIADFATAYKKLDFSDAEDPMRVVNVQLREQAEAAIKDKVATMSIDAVLSDKQPIIEELTARLRHVAEGEGSGEAPRGARREPEGRPSADRPGTDKGLGLRIVTVQIKEAIVSSARVWENLQKPFRAERARIARLAELEAETVIQAKELAAHREQEKAELESQSKVDALRAETESAAFDRERAEHTRRAALEQEAERKAAADRTRTQVEALALEKTRAEKEAEVARARLAEEIARKKTETDAQLARDAARHAVAAEQTKTDLALLADRQKIENAIGEANLHARLLATLPSLAEKMPKPAELKSISIGGAGGDGPPIAGLVAQVMSVVDAFKNGHAGDAKPAPKAKA